MSYPVSSTPGVFIDHAALSAMSDRVNRPGVRAALVGFGEYAKHLINLHPDSVVCVYDPDEWKVGIRYRAVEIVDRRAMSNATVIIVCEYPLVYEFLGEIVRLHGRVEHFIPPSISNKSTDEINVFEQEHFYRQLLRTSDDIPISMMSDDKIRFLIELLRLGLTFDGDVVEMGSWQGGSTWYMAKTLSLLDSNRTLFAMDLFEKHGIDPTATMCTDEVRLRLSRTYPRCELVVGLIDEPASLARIPGKLCFAHIDLGPIPRAMEFVWERLSTGAPLILDNYGHIRAPTWDFDDFFAARQTRVTRLPWSEQGLVFKR
jgi:predicted O-methyltransferase YrrM